ncbi:hypothetical protein P152DRAFT_454650 [Eremomyces bilateralis CBS 781.70]|uniref:Clathrin light chain n=1 Tax=Eremomyces bilateralis CBS 781.70 TaxID=1392243 RepID=A0A6G1GET3_9PEZI|nr:uncharacterized protein P152DRAFT_454650 [Eremomyces bilateralis CBS 781.70]KAF1816380.1 hypothetical protein P152DRAFT_454650 [Eremomyces bilateralis CBS 781.70]
MADRFPSLEDLDSAPIGVAPADSSASNFLDRERAALGDDADQFASTNDNIATVEDAGDDDLLGGGDHAFPTGVVADDMSGFENSFPAIDTTNEHMAPGGTITGTTAPFLPGAPAVSTSTFTDEPEPEVIRTWRETRDAQIAKRDAISSDRKATTVRDAQVSIDEFYENYNTKKEKGLAQTRREAEEFLEGREDTAAGGTSWERIAKLVDLSGKGTVGGAGGSGKERFRELLVSLRKDEKAPGASGY